MSNPIYDPAFFTNEEALKRLVILSQDMTHIRANIDAFIDWVRNPEALEALRSLGLATENIDALRDILDYLREQIAAAQETAADCKLDLEAVKRIVENQEKGPRIVQPTDDDIRDLLTDS